MHHGGEAAGPTRVVESTELVMAGAVHGHGGEAHIHTGTYDSQLLHNDIFNGQFGAAAARRGSFDNSAVYHNSAEFARHVRTAAGRGELFVAVFHGEPGPGVVHANVGDFWRQPGPGDEVLVAGLQLPGPEGVVPVLVDLLRHSAGHGEVFVGLIPGGVDADNYGYYALQPRPGAGHGEVIDDLLPDGAGHGELFVGLLPGDGVAEHNDYGYYPWQPRSGGGRGEVFIGPLPDGVSAVFVNSGSFAQQTLPGTGRAYRMAGALRVPILGAGYDSSEALADDLGAGYHNRVMVPERLRRLLPFAGIGASSVAINGLAAGPGSPAVAFHLFVLLLGGLFLVTLHVLRV